MIVNPNKQPQILITFFREKGALNLKARNFKLGEEQLLIRMLNKTVEHFKNDEIKKRLLKDAFDQKILEGKHGRK